MLMIGELARATGVATSALRYWEELGLLPVPVRVSGKRRYPASAVDVVGEILILQDAGYTLKETRALRAGGDWREVAERKLAELDEHIARAQAARTAIVHGLACTHQDNRACPNFAGLRKARLAGVPLHEAHSH